MGVRHASIHHLLHRNGRKLEKHRRPRIRVRLGRRRRSARHAATAIHAGDGVAVAGRVAAGVAAAAGVVLAVRVRGTGTVRSAAALPGVDGARPGVAGGGVLREAGREAGHGAVVVGVHDAVRHEEGAEQVHSARRHVGVTCF